MQSQIESFCPTIPFYTNEPFGERYAYHVVQDEHQCQALCRTSSLCDAMLLEEAGSGPGSLEPPQDSSGRVCSLYMKGKYTEVRGKFQSWTKQCQKGEISQNIAFSDFQIASYAGTRGGGGGEVLHISLLVIGRLG